MADFVIDILLNFFKMLLLSFYILLSFSDLYHFINASTDPTLNFVNINIMFFLPLFLGAWNIFDYHFLMSLKYLDFFHLTFIKHLLSFGIFFESINLFIFFQVRFFHLKQFICSLLSQFIIFFCFFLPLSMGCYFLNFNFLDFLLQ